MFLRSGFFALQKRSFFPHTPGGLAVQGSMRIANQARKKENRYRTSQTTPPNQILCPSVPRKRTNGSRSIPDYPQIDHRASQRCRFSHTIEPQITRTSTKCRFCNVAFKSVPVSLYLSEITPECRLTKTRRPAKGGTQFRRDPSSSTA